MLKDLSEIINSAEYVGDSEYMKDNEDIDMSELTKSLESVLAMPDEPDDEE